MLRVKTTMAGIPGAPYYNALYFSGSEISNGAGLIDAVHDFWFGLLEYSDDSLIATVDGEIDVVDLPSGDIVDVISENPQLTGGRNTGTRLSPALQGLMRLRTTAFYGGRRVQGKVFIPGLCVGAGTENPGGSVLTDWNDAATALIGAASANETPWDVYSPTNGVAPAVSSASAWNLYAVLRSRRD